MNKPVRCISCRHFLMLDRGWPYPGVCQNYPASKKHRVTAVSKCRAYEVNLGKIRKPASWRAAWPTGTRR